MTRAGRYYIETGHGTPRGARTIYFLSSTSDLSPPSVLRSPRENINILHRRLILCSHKSIMAITYQYTLFVVSSLIVHLAAGSEWDASDIQAQNEAGAAGNSGGGGMSNGGMIALCVIVGVVVIIGCSLPNPVASELSW